MNAVNENIADAVPYVSVYKAELFVDCRGRLQLTIRRMTRDLLPAFTLIFCMMLVPFLKCPSLSC